VNEKVNQRGTSGKRMVKYNKKAIKLIKLIESKDVANYFATTPLNFFQA